MKTSFFILNKTNQILLFFMLLICGCVAPIPIPEQNFNRNITGEEYAAFDLAAESIFTYKKEKAEKNAAFLKSIKIHVAENPDNKDWFDLASSANVIGLDLTNSIEEVWDQIISSSGGKDKKGHPLGADQKIAAEKILEKQKKSEELLIKILDTKKKWLDLIPKEDRSRIENGLPDFFNDLNWFSKKTKNLQIGVLQLSFAHLVFGIEKAKENMLFYFWDKINSPPIVFDRFEIVANAKNGFVKKGDRYEADIYLSPILNPFGDENTSVLVNGMRLPVKDGKANYKVTASSLGEKEYKVIFEIQNPVTGEVKSYHNDFEYSVGEHSIDVDAMKMNVLYVGVQNPISIYASGVNSNDMKVSVSGGGGGRLKKINRNQYSIVMSRPTKWGDECKINVSANGQTRTFPFRSKRIPDPVAKLGKSAGGNIGVGEFKAQQGVIAVLQNFDFDAKCKVAGFALTRIPSELNIKRDEIINKGAKYSTETRKLIEKAESGDIYTFDNVKARCPGDPAGRKINSMVFKIR